MSVVPRDVVQRVRDFPAAAENVGVVPVGEDGPVPLHQGIEPLLPGFNYAPFGDLEAAARLVDKETCAILVFGGTLAALTYARATGISASAPDRKRPRSSERAKSRCPN